MIGKAILIIVVLLIIRWLIRPVFAFEVRRTVEKMRDEERARYQQQARRDKKSEGSINVDYIPEDYNKKKKNDSSSGKGEYIDYEDVN